MPCPPRPTAASRTTRPSQPRPPAPARPGTPRRTRRSAPRPWGRTPPRRAWRPGEAFARVQPQVQADPQVAGAVAGQVPGGQERPRGERGQDEQDGQGDGVLEDHRGSPLRADRTARRRAVRAAPALRSAWGARPALIPATRARGIEARDPCRSVTRSRNRAVLVAFRGPLPSPGPAGRERAPGPGGGRGGRGRPGIPRAPRRGTRTRWRRGPG